MADPVTVAFHQLVHPGFESTTLSVNVQGVIDLLNNALHPRRKLLWSFFPRFRHAACRFPAADPGHCCFVQHDLLQVPGLVAGIVLVVRLEIVRMQRFFEVSCASF